MSAVSDLPVLVVPDATPYLPRAETESMRMTTYVFGGSTYPTLDSVPTHYPPERVWVPVNGDQWNRAKTKTEPGDFPAFRPLAVGDRVALTEPCPRCHGDWVDYEALLGGRNCRNCTEGWVVGAEATITEVLPVEQTVCAFADFSDYLDQIMSGHPMGKPNVDGVPPKLHRKGEETGTPIPGDWSSARFGVRLTDVEAVDDVG